MPREQPVSKTAKTLTGGIITVEASEWPAKVDGENLL